MANPPQGEFHCSCGFMTWDIYKYNKHVATHSFHRSRTFLCFACSQEFSSLEALRKHIWNCYSLGGKCSTCGEVVGSSSQERTAHLRTHYKFQCKLCPYVETSSQKFYRHLLTHKSSHPNYRTCPVCNLILPKLKAVNHLEDHAQLASGHIISPYSFLSNNRGARTSTTKTDSYSVRVVTRPQPLSGSNTRRRYPMFDQLS